MNLRELMEKRSREDDNADEKPATAPNGDIYVDLPNAAKQRKKKQYPTTSKSQNSLIQTLWYYADADAV